MRREENCLMVNPSEYFEILNNYMKLEDIILLLNFVNFLIWIFIFLLLLGGGK